MFYLPRFRDLRLAVTALRTKCATLRADLSDKRQELRTIREALKKPFDLSLEAPLQKAEQRAAKAGLAYQSDCEAVQLLTARLVEIRHLREQTRAHRARLSEGISSLGLAMAEDYPTKSPQALGRRVDDVI